MLFLVTAQAAPSEDGRERLESDLGKVSDSRAAQGNTGIIRSGGNSRRGTSRSKWFTNETVSR